MDFLKKINKKAKLDNDTGFGANASNYGGRFISKNGDANVKKVGISFLESVSWYHTMITIPRWKFLLVILLFYFVVFYNFKNSFVSTPNFRILYMY
jgi:inward rectifier potassium channel